MKIKANLTLATMSTRVEMAGDQPGRPAVTLKFSGVVDAEQMQGLFTNPKEGKRLAKTLWNEDGEVLATEIAALPITTEIIGGRAFLKPEMAEGITFDEVKVWGVELVPQHGRVCEVTMKINLYPDEASLWFLFTKQRTAMSVTAYPKQMALQLDTSEDIAPVQLPGDEDEGEDNHRQQNLLGDGDEQGDEQKDYGQVMPPAGMGDDEGSGIGME